LQTGHIAVLSCETCHGVLDDHFAVHEFISGWRLEVLDKLILFTHDEDDLFLNGSVSEIGVIS